MIGYLNGSFRRLFYDDDIKLPIALIAVSELIYGLVTYFCMYLLRGDFAFEAYLRQIIMPELVYTILVTLILYQIILHINKKLEQKSKGVQVNLYSLWERIKSGIAEFVQSRIFVLIIVFCITSAILVQRIFYLQIVKGQEYLDDYKLQIQKTKRD